MRGRLLLAAAGLLALSLAAACGGPPYPDADLWITVTAEKTDVEVGEAIPLTIVRGWAKTFEPAPWDDGALAPLVVRPEGEERRERGDRIVETLRYRAYAFTLKDVALPALAFVARPRAGGAPRVVRAEPVFFRVRRALDPKAPGAAELPGAMLAEPTGRWIPWGLGVGALFVALVAGLRYGRRTTTAESARAATPQTARERALERLARIRAHDPAHPSDGAETADVLRDYLEDVDVVPARERTTEEVLSATTLPHAGDLATVLTTGDQVKFATYAPSAEERGHLLDHAEAFLRDPGSATS